MYASLADVADAMGRPAASFPPEEAARIETWIALVELRVADRVPDLAARVAAGVTPASTPALVVAAAVARRAANPDGLRTTTVQVDDGSVTRTRAEDEAEGLDIPAADWALLTSRPQRPRSAFSVRPRWGS